MKLKLTRIAQCLLVGLGLSLITAATASARTYRLAYFEPGDYPTFRSLQLEFRDRLDKTAPEGIEILFSADSYKSADWDRQKSKQLAREISRSSDFDLVIAMGPWSVEDLLDAGCTKPIVAMGRFDPILEGIASSSGEPIKKNLTVRIRPAKIETDFAALTTIFPECKRVGLLFFPSANESKVVEDYFKQQAAKYNLEIVAIPADPGDPNYKFFAKVTQLRDQVDVFYMTPLYGMPLDQINSFFAELVMLKIPVFGSEGFFQVERGAFASNTSMDAHSVARFHVDKIFKILKGATPQSLPTAFREGRRLSLNLKSCDTYNIHPAPHLIAEARLVSQPPPAGVTVYTPVSALEQADRFSPVSQANDSRQSALDARYSARRSDYWPQVSINGYLNSYDNDPPANALRRITEGKSGYELRVTQKIVDLQALKHSSVIANEVAVEKALNLINEQSHNREIVLKYLQLQYLYELRDLYEEHRERVNSGLQVASARYQMQSTDRAELVLWESLKDELTAKIVTIRSAARVSEMEFINSLGRPADEQFTIDRGIYPLEAFRWSPQGPPMLGSSPGSREIAEDFWASVAVTKSPFVTLARNELATSESRLSANSASFWPSLGGSARYFSDDLYGATGPLTVDEDGFILGAQLTWNLFEGGGRIKERKRLQFEKTAQEYLVDQALLSSAQSARAAFTEMTVAYDATLFAGKSKDGVDEALKEVFQSYNYDEASVEAITNLMDRRLSACESKLDAALKFHQSTIDFWFTLGYGFVTPSSPIAREVLEQLDSTIKAEQSR